MEVAEGEVVHLRGPNGAGKTSVLKVLAGLLEVHSGEAMALGRDLVADRRAVRRDVGMLGHQSFLYEDLTVEENLRFVVRASRGDLTGIRPALERLGFTGRLASTPVGRCSAGQQRRASLAALLARNARLWLLDEPHAGLDQDGRDLLDELLVGSRAAGRTVVFASHEHERADSIADRVIHLAGGRVIEPVEPVGAACPVEPVGAACPVEPAEAAGPHVAPPVEPPIQPAPPAAPRSMTEVPAHVA